MRWNNLEEFLHLKTSSFTSSHMEFLQLPEKLMSLSVLGEQLKAPWNLLVPYHANMIPMGLRGPSKGELLKQWISPTVTLFDSTMKKIPVDATCAGKISNITSKLNSRTVPVLPSLNLCHVIIFHLLPSPGAPYRILFLYLPRLTCHFLSCCHNKTTWLQTSF